MGAVIRYTYGTYPLCTRFRCGTYPLRARTPPTLRAPQIKIHGCFLKNYLLSQKPHIIDFDLKPIRMLFIDSVQLATLYRRSEA